MASATMPTVDSMIVLVDDANVIAADSQFVLAAANIWSREVEFINTLDALTSMFDDGELMSTSPTVDSASIWPASFDFTSIVALDRSRMGPADANVVLASA